MMEFHCLPRLMHARRCCLIAERCAPRARHIHTRVFFAILLRLRIAFSFGRYSPAWCYAAFVDTIFHARCHTIRRLSFHMLRRHSLIRSRRRLFALDDADTAMHGLSPCHDDCCHTYFRASVASLYMRLSSRPPCSFPLFTAGHYEAHSSRLGSRAYSLPYVPHTLAAPP